MTPEFKVDFERGARIGLDEALFCESKTVDQIAAIVDAVRAKTGRMLLTRLDQSKYEALLVRHGAELEFDPLSRTAILGHPRPTLVTGPVAIVMAGTSDLPVGREAARTLAFAGQPYREYTDIGVAGLWRLLEKIEDIRLSPVVIVAAGMDAALVSVVGGLVSSPVIALPTSVGYGVALGGAAALHAALVSCAPGISVVNIDNGYGAACAALRILRAMAASQPRWIGLRAGLLSLLRKLPQSSMSLYVDPRHRLDVSIAEIAVIARRIVKGTFRPRPCENMISDAGVLRNSGGSRRQARAVRPRSPASAG